MKDINYVRAVAKQCIEDLNAIGIYPNITPNDVTINNRLQRVWGRCWTHWENNSRTKWHFTIEVSSKLLGDDVPDKSLRSNLFHEMCHSCDECVNVHHGGKWKEYAELINDCYNMNIQRCTSSAEYNVEDNRKAYGWKCSACGKKFVKMGYKAPKWYIHPKGYTHKNCPCGKGYVMSEYYGYKLV